MVPPVAGIAGIIIAKQTPQVEHFNDGTFLDAR
jgi:hypothetical protein